MKPNSYVILSRAVEEGIDIGYIRSFKYTDIPTTQDIKNRIYEEVMNSICEVFTFENGDKIV
jgi:hypothetical protein